MKRIISQCIFYIHNRTFFKMLFYKLFLSWKKSGEKRKTNKLKSTFNYKLNIVNPQTFNEYILWLKRNYRNEKWCECADKLKCKDFLFRNGFGEFMPKTLKTYKKSKDIRLDELPEKFVLKTNHDCGSVFICDKNTTNFKRVFKKLDSSIYKDYSVDTDEWVYEGIEPQIFAEEYLESKTGGQIADYKFFVFNGKYRFGYYCVNRKSDIRFQLFENDFDVVNCEYTHLRPSKKQQIKRPSEFSAMVKIVEKIGSLFDFVRVDLYLTKQGIRLGELTFLPMSGFGPFVDSSFDFRYGKFFEETEIGKLAKKSL